MFTALNPQGASVIGFKQPTPLELEHDFLWHVHPHAPSKGWVAIFNRSHYEDGILKFFLHISKAEQLARFEQRLDDPARNWKISESDYSERELWDDYVEAFEDALGATSRDHAPWYVSLLTINGSATSRCRRSSPTQCRTSVCRFQSRAWISLIYGANTMQPQWRRSGCRRSFSPSRSSLGSWQSRVASKAVCDPGGP